MGVTNIDFWLCIGIAAICGTVLGLERQMRGKPAGVRTSILICMGTAIFIRLGAFVGAESGDPTRVLGQVVSGVGFIGAGVMLARDRLIIGVTSAAVIWMLAALGATIGFGFYGSALILAFVSLLFLEGIGYLEHQAGVLPRGDGDTKRSDGAE